MPATQSPARAHARPLVDTAATHAAQAGFRRPGIGAEDHYRALLRQTWTVRTRAVELRQQAAAARARAAVLRGTAMQVKHRSGVLLYREDLLRYSELAHLRARLETMPMIEQAKGIIMARYGCRPDEAFDLLRRASQRSNVRVRELAAQLVAKRSGLPRLRPAAWP